MASKLKAYNLFIISFRLVIVIIAAFATNCYAAMQNPAQIAPSYDFMHPLSYSEAEAKTLDAIHKTLSIRHFQLNKLLDLVEKLDWLPKSWILQQSVKYIDRNTDIKSLNRLSQHIKSAKLDFYLLHHQLANGAKSLQDPKTLNFLKQTWQKVDFSLQDEQYFFKIYEHDLEFIDQKNKIERNLMHHNLQRAEFLINNYKGASRHLQRFRMRVARDSHNFHNILLKNNKKQENDPIANYYYIKLLLKRGQNQEAYDRLLKITPNNFQAKWWKVYYNAAREAVKERRYKIAIDLAKKVNMAGDINHEEQQWFIGWVKLNFLDLAREALDDFASSHKLAYYSMSKSRASYWALQAAKKANNLDAQNSWQQTLCNYKIRFYGQLAPCSKIAIVPSEAVQITNITDRKILDLAKYYTNKKDYIRSYQAINKIAKILNHKYSYDSIANYYNNYGIMYPGVMMSKHLINRYAKVKDYGFPVLEFNASKKFKIIYHGIIRQESEFNYIAKSHAGAFGLMQLMPATAKNVAKKLKLHHASYMQKPRLNIKSGIFYFDEMVDKYESIVLAICAYNAGPGNVNRWLKQYGDYRTLKTLNEKLNWIEQIPFYETRMYVKKVLENAYVYSSVIGYQTNSVADFL